MNAAISALEYRMALFPIRTNGNSPRRDKVDRYLSDTPSRSAVSFGRSND